MILTARPSRRRRVMLGGADLCKVIFGNKYILALLFLPFFKTTAFEAVPGLATVCNALILVEGAGFFLLSALTGRLSPSVKLIALYGVWCHIIVPLASGGTPPSLFYICGALGMVCYFELGFSVDPRLLLRVTSTVSTAMIIFNWVNMMIFPRGMTWLGAAIYLFGLRTGFSLFIIPALLFCLLDDSLRADGRFSFKTLLCAFFGVASLVQQWVATGIVELLVVVVLYVAALWDRRGQFVRARLFVAASLVLDYIITIAGSRSTLLALVTRLLGKDITFTGRSEIWSNSLATALEKPVWGHGLDAYTIVNEQVIPAHNHWLHYLLEGGFVGLALMLAAVWLSCSRLSRLRSRQTARLITAFLTAMLVAAITEIQIYVPFFYAVMELPFLVGGCETESERLPRRPALRYRIQK